MPLPAGELECRGPAWGVALALLLALALPLCARSAVEYSVVDGLSQNSVLAMVEDAEGFVWLATEDGLNRFDGYEFRVYRPSEALGLGAAANYITDLAIRDPYLFLASNGGGLLIFDRREGRFRHIGVDEGLLGEHLNAVEPTGPGSLLLASRGGLERLTWTGDPMRAEIQVERLATQPEHAEREFWELHASSSGQWVASGDGVFRVDSNGELLPFPVQGAVAPFNTDALLEFPAGVLWVGAWDQGLFRVRLDTGETRHFRPGDPDAVGLRSSRVISLAAGPDGIVFVGTDQGLARFEPSCDCLRVMNHRRAARLAGRGFLVQSLLADAEGGLFAGYWGEGLVRFTPQDRAFHVEGYRDEGPAALNHHRVRAILESRAGELWVGTFGGGLQRVRGERRLGEPWHFETVPFAVWGATLPPAAGLVWALLEGRDGRLWAGTDDGLYLRPAEGQAWRRERAAGEPVPMAGVRVLAEDARGRLWVGSSSGLGRVEAGGQERERIALTRPEFPLWRRRQMENIQSLYIDPQQRVWVGSWAGLAILDAEGRTLMRYGVEEGLPAPVVWDIHRHADGSVWLATSGGLVRVHAPESPEALGLEPWGAARGLPPGPALGLVSDRAGALWVTGNRGLMRLDPATGAVRLFGRAQGIASDEFATQAETLGRDGWLYLGGIDGLTAFDPSALPDALEPPRPRLASISIDGGAPVAELPAGLDSPLRLQLGHDHAPVLLDFTGLVFNQPDAVRYRYRLRPESPWIDLGTRRSLIIDHLPEGSSQLQLQVDNQGLTAEAALVAFSVVPPWTHRWTFRALMVLLVAAAIVLLYLWRVRALTLQRARLEREVEDRTRELRRQKEALEATALALGEANARLKTLSQQDPLTGLRNRRSLIEQMQHRFQPGGDPPAVLLIDLDHFKRVNDSYGHRAGDVVLRDFAELLLAEVPAEGEVGRWGGEEFLCLLPSRPPEFAWEWGERLLARLRLRRVRVEGQVIEYRASAGLAFAAAGSDIDATLALADGALYAAKSAGRDCLRQA